MPVVRSALRARRGTHPNHRVESFSAPPRTATLPALRVCPQQHALYPWRPEVLRCPGYNEDSAEVRIFGSSCVGTQPYEIIMLGLYNNGSTGDKVITILENVRIIAHSDKHKSRESKITFYLI